MKINNLWYFHIKKQLIAITILILITNLSIIFDIYIFRQLLGFITFTLIVGFLIVTIFDLDELDNWSKLVVSMGLGVSFLMFFGLFINSLFFIFGFVTPLSTISLLISFNIILGCLCIFAYKRNEKKVIRINKLHLINPKTALIFIMPFVFLVLSIIGVEIMNTTQNNVILLLLYIIIPSYLLYIIFSKKDYPNIYPFIIWLISLSMIFMLSLRSDHIIGYDVHYEYYISKLTVEKLHWDISRDYGPVNALLTVGLLPTIYYSLLNINIEFIYKIIYATIFSMTPLILYLYLKEKMEIRYAFLASLFFISQSTFILISQSNPRTSLAIFFFVIIVMILFNEKINIFKKRILVIIFTFSIIFSHYSSTYIFLFIFMATYFIMFLVQKKIKVETKITSTFLKLCIVLIFVWYSMSTSSSFTVFIKLLNNIMQNLTDFFLLESRHAGTLKVLGVNARTTPDIIYSLGHYLITAIIFIGILYAINNFKKEKRGKFRIFFQSEEIIMMSISFAILTLLIILPIASLSYSIDRLWMQVLVFLSPAFILGCIFISKQKRFYSLLIISFILLFHFYNSSYIFYEFYGIHKSMIINSDGEDYSHFFIHEQEIVSAKWLKNKQLFGTKVYTDFDGGSRLNYGSIHYDWYSMNFFRQEDHSNNDKNYIYLSYSNVVNGIIFTGERYTNISDFNYIFIEKNLIYDNGASQIYK